MHHWHTVGLDIPCRVARLQRPTPPPSDEQFRTLKDNYQESIIKIEGGTQVASRGPTWRIATPPV